ncbi:MAG: cytochrome c3 family protein [Rhodoplanes sp.]
MFAAGVTCSDCHDPHSAKLRYPGDDTCLQCHSTEKYANAKHAGHEAANPPLGCVSCHMPVRNYMVVDPRHDHSFRVPRPDLSAKLGTPNACNDLSRRQAGRVGGHRGRALARAGPEKIPELRRSPRCGMDRQGERAHAACRGCCGRRHARDCARERAHRTCVAPLALEYRLGAARPRRSRSDGAHRRPRHAGKCAGRADLAVRGAALV